VFLVWQILFNVSYMNPAPFTIPPHENVFIAANIIDEDLINGSWGESLMELVDIIGKDRVFVSVYGGPTSALKDLAHKLECNNSLVSEETYPIDWKGIPHVVLPTGESKVKRITFLAEVRNKALEPLDTSPTKYHKVLFLNDIIFNPHEAARLLWATNVKDGKAEYKAACAVDFVRPWKFYDTFATRDLEGYGIGVPFFPWFANEGEARSRRDVLEGRDAVRVKSCWGGMVAFDGKVLQRHMRSPGEDAAHEHLAEVERERAVESLAPPVRFRSEPEPFWDSSECCLIHADIAALDSSSRFSNSATDETGIFMNPFVRVSYSASTQRCLPLVKRFERLFAIPHRLINYYAHMPRYNSRRAEIEGDVIHDNLWISDQNKPPSSINTLDDEDDIPEKEFGSEDTTWQGSGTHAIEGDVLRTGNLDWDARGHYEPFDRVARRGAFCMVRQLLVMKEGKIPKGETNWENLLGMVPPLALE
jgi:hypothetical protein